MPVKGKHLLHLVPHGINSSEFKPLPNGDSSVLKLKKEYLGDKEYNFIVAFNSRNAHRKHPANLIMAFKSFCNSLNPEDAKKCALIMHTDKICEAGTDLVATINAVCPEYTVILDESRKTPDEMVAFYNLADVTANVSCIPPGYKVITKSGYKNIETIKIGDLVLTHKGRYRKVNKTFVHTNNNCEMVKITPSNLKTPVELTAEHPILCVKRKDMKNAFMNENSSVEQYIKWVKAGDIEKSDLVLMPIINNEELTYDDTFEIDVDTLFNENKKYKLIDNKLSCINSYELDTPIKISEELCYVLGKWCGDGSGNTIAFDKKHGLDPVHITGKAIKKAFNADYGITENNTHNCYILSINTCNHLITSIFKHYCGTESSNKHIPDFILYNKNVKYIKSFLDGLYDSDGTDFKKYPERQKLSTVSDLLKNQLIISLLRLNKNVHIDFDKSGYKPSSMINVIKWSKFFRGKKEENGSRRSWFRDGYYMTSVKSIEKRYYTGKVYNMEVDEDNSYTMDSFTVHNSNEGFGLSIAESIMCGTPVIATVTGGLQDQLGIVDDNNNPVEFTLEFGTNVTGKYKKHGIWARPIWTTAQSMQGSPPTPYIMDDMTDYSDIADAIMYWYLLGGEKREEYGLEGRRWAMNEGGINSINMCNQFIKAMDYTLEHFTPVKQFDIFNPDEYDTKTLPQGKLGFELHVVDVEKIKQNILNEDTNIKK